MDPVAWPDSTQVRFPGAGLVGGQGCHRASDDQDDGDDQLDREDPGALVNRDGLEHEEEEDVGDEEGG